MKMIGCEACLSLLNCVYEMKNCCYFSGDTFEHLCSIIEDNWKY